MTHHSKGELVMQSKPQGEAEGAPSRRPLALAAASMVGHSACSRQHARHSSRIGTLHLAC